MTSPRTHRQLAFWCASCKPFPMLCDVTVIRVESCKSCFLKEVSHIISDFPPQVEGQKLSLLYFGFLPLRCSI